MNLTKTAVGLSLTLFMAALVHACQPEGIQDSRGAATGATAPQASKADDAAPEDKKPGAPATNTGNTPAAPAANYTMTWDVSADAAIVSYKVFVVPPDRNPRFPGKLDVPVQIKNYPIADLQKNGEKYSVVVSSDEIKAALGSTVTTPISYCFTIVAVNAVGNSSHSPVICP
ncbi:hypothetical protein [Oligoflexus tunisiensis]|uniref:hypothetical protein n=1 Tax=Oligoflexus tunisiensis TaxID=708132 RepID=UPI00114C97B5|nr:hypothetical protein [Oligoflexus tunisiensis]